MRKESCIVCGKGHVVDQCKEFMKKISKEKTKIITKEEFDFGSCQS